jgi:hypothetical protein
MFKKVWLWIASFFEKKEKVTEVRETSKPKKKAVATYHAKERLEERHGEVLTDHMTASFIHDIKNGQSEFVKDTRDDTQSWIVTYKNKRYRVIYNAKTEVLVTIYSTIKNKRIKSGRRRKNKIQKKMHLYDASVKREKTQFKKPYKRNKRVDYREYNDAI